MMQIGLEQRREIRCNGIGLAVFVIKRAAVIGDGKTCPAGRQMIGCTMDIILLPGRAQNE